MIEDWFDREQVVIVQGKRAKRYKSTDAPGVDDIPGLRSKMEVKTHKVMQDAKDRGIRLWIFSGGEAGGDTIFGKEAEEMGHRVFYNPAIADVKAGHITDPKIDVSGSPYHRIIDDRFMDIIPPAGTARRDTPIATRNYLDRQRGENKNWRLVRRYLRDDPEGKIAAGTATTADLPLPQKMHKVKKIMVDQNWFADDFQFRNLANIHDATKKHEELSATPGTKTLPIISMTLHDKTREERGVVDGPKGGSFGNETKVLGINIPVFEIMTNKVTKPENRYTSQDFNSIWDAPKERKAEDYSSTTGKPVVVVPVDKDGKISIGEGLAKLSESAPKTYEHQRLEFRKLLENPDIEVRKSTDIQSKDIINNPNAIFIFGDNSLRDGKGGQAIVFRDLQNRPNVVGLVTKYSPEKKFKKDDEAEKQQIEFQDKDFKNLYNRISQQKELSSFDTISPSRAVTETKQDREAALDKLHTEELEEFEFGDSLPAMIETWEGKKGTFVSEKTKPIIEERIAAAEAKAGPTDKQKLKEKRAEFVSTLPNEIFLPSDSTKTGSFLFPTSLDQRKDFDKPIGIKLNKEEKERIARKAITLESDIDATGIETGRLIGILKEMRKPVSDLDDTTVIEDEKAGTDAEPSDEKVDVTPENIESLTGDAASQDYIATLISDVRTDSEAHRDRPNKYVVKKSKMIGPQGQIIPRQQIQESAVSDILTSKQIAAIEARNYVSTENLKHWWNPETGYTIPPSEQTSRKGDFPALASAQTDKDIFDSKMWTNPDDGKVYTLTDALQYKFRGVPLPADGEVSTHLTTIEKTKLEMVEKQPTLDDMSSLFPVGTTTTPVGVGGVVSKVHFEKTLPEDLRGTFEDKNVQALIFKKIRANERVHYNEYKNKRTQANKEIIGFGKWKTDVYPTQNNFEDSQILIDDLDQSLYLENIEAVDKARRNYDTSIAGLEVRKLSSKPKTVARNLLRAVQETTPNNYDNLPATERRQFEAYLGEFAATGIKPKGFPTAYNNILLKMNVGESEFKQNWTLNKEELSGSPYFKIENEKLVATEWDPVPREKKIQRWLDIRFKEAALMNPDEKLNSNLKEANVLASIQFRINRANAALNKKLNQNSVILETKKVEKRGKIRLVPLTPDDIKEMTKKEQNNLFERYIFKLRNERKNAQKIYTRTELEKGEHVFPHGIKSKLPPQSDAAHWDEKEKKFIKPEIITSPSEAYEQSTERKFLDLIDTDITNMSDDQKQGLLDKLRKIEPVPKVKDRQSMLENINGGMIYDEAGSRIPTKEGTHFKTFDKKPSELLDVKIAEITTSFVSEPVDSFKTKVDEEQSIIDETQLYAEAFTDKVKPIDLKTETGSLKDIHAKPVSGIPVITRRDLSQLDKRHGSLSLKPRTKAERESLLTDKPVDITEHDRHIADYEEDYFESTNYIGNISKDFLNQLDVTKGTDKDDSGQPTSGDATLGDVVDKVTNGNDIPYLLEDTPGVHYTKEKPAKTGRNLPEGVSSHVENIPKPDLHPVQEFPMESIDESSLGKELSPRKHISYSSGRTGEMKALESKSPDVFGTSTIGQRTSGLTDYNLKLSPSQKFAGYSTKIKREHRTPEKIMSDAEKERGFLYRVNPLDPKDARKISVSHERKGDLSDYERITAGVPDSVFLHGDSRWKKLGLKKAPGHYHIDPRVSIGDEKHPSWIDPETGVIPKGGKRAAYRLKLTPDEQKVQDEIFEEMIRKHEGTQTLDEFTNGKGIPAKIGNGDFKKALTETVTDTSIIGPKSSGFANLMVGKMKFIPTDGKEASETLGLDAQPLTSVNVKNQKREDKKLQEAYIKEASIKANLAEADRIAQAEREAAARQAADREEEQRLQDEDDAKEEDNWNSLTVLQQQQEKKEQLRKERAQFDKDDWEDNYERSFGETGKSIFTPIKSSDSRTKPLSHTSEDIIKSAKEKIDSDAVLNGRSGDPTKNGNHTNFNSLENNDIIGAKVTVKDIHADKNEANKKKSDREAAQRQKEWHEKYDKSKYEHGGPESQKVGLHQRISNIWSKTHPTQRRVDRTGKAITAVPSKVGSGFSSQLEKYREQKLAMAAIQAQGGGGRGARDSLASNAALIRALSGANQQPMFGSTMSAFKQDTTAMMGSGQSRLTDMGNVGQGRGSLLTDFTTRMSTQQSGLTDFTRSMNLNQGPLTDFSAKVGTSSGHLGGALAHQMQAGEGGGTRGIFSMGERFLTSRQEPTSLRIMKDRDKDIASFSLGGTLGVGGSMRPDQGIGSPSGFLSGELIPQRQTQETQNRAPNGTSNGAGFRGRLIR